VDQTLDEPGRSGRHASRSAHPMAGDVFLEAVAGSSSARELATVEAERRSTGERQ